MGCVYYKLLGIAEEESRCRKLEQAVGVRMNCHLWKEIKDVTSRKLFRVCFCCSVAWSCLLCINDKLLHPTKHGKMLMNAEAKQKKMLNVDKILSECKLGKLYGLFLKVLIASS